MRNLFMSTVAAALFGAIGVVAVSTADAAQIAAADTNGPHMGTGMPPGMPNGGMMGMHDGMMAQMSQMMEGCNATMQRHGQQSAPPSAPAQPQ